MNKAASITAAWLVTASAALAFPTWIGVYGEFQRHTPENPGTFNILMNESAQDLRAEVGIQVNGGPWVTYPMGLVGVRQGNSHWQFRPAFPFQDNAEVKFYFHGHDQAGHHIWDSNNGANYSFKAGSGSGGLQFGKGAAQTNEYQDACVVGDTVYLVNQGRVCRGSVVAGTLVWSPWSNLFGRAASIAGSANLMVAAEVEGHALRIHRKLANGSVLPVIERQVTDRELGGVEVAVRGSEIMVAFGKIIPVSYSPTYGSHELWVMTSEDVGARFSEPVKVAEYNPNSNGTFIDTTSWEAGATSNAWVMGYRVVYPGAAHHSYELIYRVDGGTWMRQHVKGGKYVGNFDAAVAPGGALACGSDMFAPKPTVLMLEGTNWIDAAGNLAVTPYATETFSVGMADDQAFFFKRSPAQTNTVDLWAMDSATRTWSICGTVGAPLLAAGQNITAPRFLAGDNRVFLRWGHGVWQVSTHSCPEMKWAGNTYHWPPNEELDAGDSLWVNVESWPAGAGDAALVVYSTDRINWGAMPMARVGQRGQNDWWHANIGKFPAGKVIEYATAVIDCNGTYHWDSRNGENYRAVVKAAPAVKWVGNTSFWPVQGQIDPDDNLWINTESWPKGAGASATLVYTGDGVTWKTARMAKAGEIGNNDWWHINLGKFTSGTTIRFAVMVQDENGTQLWDNNNGKDYRAQVN